MQRAFLRNTFKMYINLFIYLECVDTQSAGLEIEISAWPKRSICTLFVPALLLLLLLVLSLTAEAFCMPMKPMRAHFDVNSQCWHRRRPINTLVFRVCSCRARGLLLLVRIRILQLFCILCKFFYYFTPDIWDVGGHWHTNRAGGNNKQ